MLMANTPPADVELLFHASLLECQPAKSSGPPQMSMRMRVSRHKQTIEISKRMHGFGDDRRAEWSKKIYPFKFGLQGAAGDIESPEIGDESSLAELVQF